MEEEEAGEKEKERHVEAVDDAVHESVERHVQRDAGIENAARHMTIDDQYDADGLGVIHPGIATSRLIHDFPSHCCCKSSGCRRGGQDTPLRT